MVPLLILADAGGQEEYPLLRHTARALGRLVSEATRIRLASWFDPCVAVSCSTIDPLPHQISEADARSPRGVSGGISIT